LSNSSDVHASLLLSNLSCITPSHYQLLLNRYGSAARAVEAGHGDWGLPVDEAEWAQASRFADQEGKEIEAAGIRLYLWQESDYPALLKLTSAAPPIIYVHGNGFAETAFPLAVVGSRRPTYYGEKVARGLAGDLTEAGVTTVSGLARGIDSCVHGETIKRGGTTWAVLGSGLLNLYPRENRTLADKILEQGALISEFPLHMPPYRGHFPRRNRIIAGLSHATIVVEGDEKSGSLITARLAAEEGREVFAVPGPIHSRLSRGPHRLIQSGAALINDVEDIFSQLPDHVRALKPFPELPAKEEKAALSSIPEVRLFTELASTAISRDVLIERLKIPAAELSALLLTLELKGLVRALPGGFIERA
jgi:DNA processing protein